MGVLLTAKSLKKAFDSRPLFQGLNFTIESGEKVGLIGPNGAGKSTLLKILASETTADDGEFVVIRGTKISYIDQVPKFTPNHTVRDTLLEGVEDPNDWEAYIKADQLLWKLNFEDAHIQPETLVDSLSGGWKKRLALARALMKEPDLLLLDEPTNHLDVSGIIWLEEFIRGSKIATLTITHDRLFLDRVSTRILELDRRHAGGVLNVKGNYSHYLSVRESLLKNQENSETILRGNLRRETEWLNAGAKARTTKQQARILRHAELAEEVQELASRNISRSAQFEFQGSEQNPNRLLDATKVSKSYPDRGVLFAGLDLLLRPGTRLGLLGENGCGKSTLIRVLLGLENPDSGKIFRSDQLKVSYFEQNRDTLDPKQSVLRTLCPHGDHVFYHGRPIHIRSYLDRFLFTQQQMDMPVRSLSGGEQSRLLIARLMLEEANLLVLDEPTNDLDIATLNVLQDCLTEFDGAIILVSHDRFFLDQVSTQILSFPLSKEDQKLGKLLTFSDFAQWEAYRVEAKNASSQTPEKSKTTERIEPKVQKANSNQADAVSKKLAKAEASYAKLEAECCLPENVSDMSKLHELGIKMKNLQTEIDQLYEEWQKLEG